MLYPNHGRYTRCDVGFRATLSSLALARQKLDDRHAEALGQPNQGIQPRIARGLGLKSPHIAVVQSATARELLLGKTGLEAQSPHVLSQDPVKTIVTVGAF